MDTASILRRDTILVSLIFLGSLVGVSLSTGWVIYTLVQEAGKGLQGSPSPGAGIGAGIMVLAAYAVWGVLSIGGATGLTAIFSRGKDANVPRIATNLSMLALLTFFGIPFVLLKLATAGASTEAHALGQRENARIAALQEHQRVERKRNPPAPEAAPADPLTESASKAYEDLYLEPLKLAANLSVDRRPDDPTVRWVDATLVVPDDMPMDQVIGWYAPKCTDVQQNETAWVGHSMRHPDHRPVDITIYRSAQGAYPGKCLVRLKVMPLPN